MEKIPFFSIMSRQLDSTGTISSRIVRKNQSVQLQMQQLFLFSSANNYRSYAT
jgi:hypothetical protein